MSGLTGVLHSPPLNKDSSRIQNCVLTVILSYHVLSDTGHPILTVILVISIITWKCIRYYIIGKENLHGVDGAAAVITPDNLCSDTKCHIPVFPGTWWAGDGLATTRTPDSYWPTDWLKQILIIFGHPHSYDYTTPSINTTITYINIYYNYKHTNIYKARWPTDTDFDLGPTLTYWSMCNDCLLDLTSPPQKEKLKPAKT